MYYSLIWDSTDPRVAIFVDSSPRCKECRSLEIDNQFQKVSNPVDLYYDADIIRRSSTALSARAAKKSIRRNTRS